MYLQTHRRLAFLPCPGYDGIAQTKMRHIRPARGKHRCAAYKRKDMEGGQYEWLVPERELDLWHQ
ncbi:MAG: hypothetical protein NC311_10920 [Muribaculaceae bacterium]|nr:hypothetical protein [Muribaculaceae bacterium]